MTRCKLCFNDPQADPDSIYHCIGEHWDVEAHVRFDGSVWLTITVMVPMQGRFVDAFGYSLARQLKWAGVTALDCGRKTTYEYSDPAKRSGARTTVRADHIREAFAKHAPGIEVQGE